MLVKVRVEGPNHIPAPRMLASICRPWGRGMGRYRGRGRGRGGATCIRSCSGLRSNVSKERNSIQPLLQSSVFRFQDGDSSFMAAGLLVRM